MQSQDLDNDSVTTDQELITIFDNAIASGRYNYAWSIMEDEDVLSLRVNDDPQSYERFLKWIVKNVSGAELWEQIWNENFGEEREPSFSSESEISYHSESEEEIEHSEDELGIISEDSDSEQHLNREQVLDMFRALEYPVEDIVSLVNIGEFHNVEISSREALLQAISYQAISNIFIQDRGRNNQLILFRVNAETRSFAENEVENNHYVALHFSREVQGNLVLTYIDPTAELISESIREVISSHPGLSSYVLRNSRNALQYTNPNYDHGIYQMGGNDYDCGVFVALAARMVRNNIESRDEINLNENDSIELGQILRRVARGDSSLSEDHDDIIDILVRRNDPPLVEQQRIKRELDSLSSQLQQVKLDDSLEDSLSELTQQKLSLRDRRERLAQEANVMRRNLESYQRHDEEVENSISRINYEMGEDNEGYSLDIHQIDVGQGESSLIVCRNGEKINWAVLLDAGARENGNAEYIVSYIKNNIGERKLDAVIITHDDCDHHGNFLNEGNRHPLAEVLNEYYLITQEYYYKMTQEGSIRMDGGDPKYLLEKNIWTLLGKRKPFGNVPDMVCISVGAHVRGKKGNKNLEGFLSSDSNKKNNDFAEKRKNERGLGFLIEFGGFKFYTAGDLPSQIEDQINIGKVSAFKASHHGSKFSTSSSLVSSLRPRAAVISHGSYEKHDHPSQNVLNNLDESNTVQFTYMTNPIGGESVEKKEFVENNNKIVVSGRNTLLRRDNKGKAPRGNVCFRITEAQSRMKDVFFVKYYRDYEESLYFTSRTTANRKKARIVDNFTNIKALELQKITSEQLRSQKEVEIESSSRMKLQGVSFEEGRIQGSLCNSNTPQELLKMSGYYRSKGQIYNTGGDFSDKSKKSRRDHVVLKLTTQTFEENRTFLRSLNPQAYDELMNYLPDNIKEKIENNTESRTSKIKVKASNEGDSSVSLSWIEKSLRRHRNFKHKIKIKSLIDDDTEEERRFVDRASFSVTEKTSR